MQKFARVLCTPLMLWLAGCAGNQSGTESGRPNAECTILTQTSVLRDEGTELGTPEQLAEAHSVSKSAPLRWFSHDERGTYTDTVVDVQLLVDADSAVYVEYADQDENNLCGPTLQLATLMGFETEDGAFSEQAMGQLEVGASSERLTAQLPRNELAGSYIIKPDVEGAYIEPVLSFRTKLSPLSGSLSMEDADQDGNMLSAGIAAWGDNF